MQLWIPSCILKGVKLQFERLIWTTFDDSKIVLGTQVVYKNKHSPYITQKKPHTLKMLYIC